jgi:hypothetical protein
VITHVTSDEADNAPGNADGNTVADIKIANNCKSVDLRSERMDGGNGRVYTIYFMVEDASGNVSTSMGRAIAAPNQSGVTAIDDGALYTVFSNCTPVSAPTQSVASEEMSDDMFTRVQLVTVKSHPNPFTDFTTIRYSLPADAHVSLEIFNSLGQKLAHPVNAKVSAGQHAVRFDAAKYGSGVYMYRLQTTDANGKPVTLNGKMVLAK